MIDLYAWNTPNGRKVAIMLEELGVPYAIKAIDITKGEQKQPAYININPNGRIPAIYDHLEQTRVFESGAILVYLAEKNGRFLPHQASQKAEVMSWLFWQSSGLGPMLGQFNHFNAQEKSQVYACDRFKGESLRLLSVLNKQLENKSYVAGNEYSIADIMNYSWVETAYKALLKSEPISVDQFSGLMAWKNRLAKRSAIIAAHEKLSNLSTNKY